VWRVATDIPAETLLIYFTYCDGGMRRAYSVPDLVDLGAAAADDAANQVVGNLHLVHVMLYEPGRCAGVVGSSSWRRRSTSVAANTQT